ncbi:MAG: hypothetical protein R3Y18_04270 [Bacillota bacterium]
MKRIFTGVCTVLFFIIGFSPLAGELAFGENFYGRAETSTVGFYASETDENPMFYIPLGYYVYITGETDDFYYCEYAKSESSYIKKYGFVKKDEIYIDSDMALPLFPEITLTAIKDSNLYSKAGKETVVSSITAGQSAYFYGLYQDGEVTLYYVKISGDFGYVETSGFEQLVIPTHPKQLSTDTAGVVFPEDEEVFETETAGVDVSETADFQITFDLQIAMILCVAVPALAILFYVFKPQSDSVTKYFDS